MKEGFFRGRGEKKLPDITLIVRTTGTLVSFSSKKEERKRTPGEGKRWPLWRREKKEFY